MKKRYNPYSYPKWLKSIRAVCAQFMVPISVFQGIRTLIFPTGFDVLLFALIIFLAVAIHLQII
ncbi:hypothetical protein M3182_18085 [Mesobacillus maritimus]|uniref:hypothetical protein n=1 Tax=Mesobacillus maritimus TaxID=1643336 RepID=UPI00203F0C54|nr:hypothetical protein [Mesobacillus maritimus]MCM3587649.1 hypothetical protein [Mesobacillus maritimus]MCM3669894.1 hypothetical protein [Mesobacillus maritimus]